MANKFGKCIPPQGQQVVYGSVLLQPGGLTAMLIPNGISGNAATLWLDVYGVDISSNDSTTQQVSLSDGTNSVTWIVAAPSAVCSSSEVPFRFARGAPLFATASNGTSGKPISVTVRGVLSST